MIQFFFQFPLARLVADSNQLRLEFLLSLTGFIIKTENVLLGCNMYSYLLVLTLSQMVFRAVCSAVPPCSYHRVSLAPRQNLPRIILKGIFQGVKVVRGPDWDWGNQDGEWSVWGGGCSYH